VDGERGDLLRHTDPRRLLQALGLAARWQRAGEGRRTRKASSSTAPTWRRWSIDHEKTLTLVREAAKTVIRANGTVRITTPHGRFFIRSVVTRLQQICAEEAGIAGGVTLTAQGARG
jgi:hypothetical protein